MIPYTYAIYISFIMEDVLIRIENRNVPYPEQEKHLRILYSNHFHISMTENRVPCITINGTFHLIILKINESQIQDISSNFSFCHHKSIPQYLIYHS